MPLLAPKSNPAGREIPAYTQPLLNRLIEVHERFVRREPGGRRAVVRYLQGVDLDFSGRDLTEADFTGANLRRAVLAGANFERASLYCAELIGAVATDANFRRADLRGASLRHADLSGAVLDEADLREASLARVDLPGGFKIQGGAGAAADEEPAASFANASLKGARLQRANLRGADFSGAIMHGVKLKGASLAGAVFHGAVLTGVNLTGLDIELAAMSGCVTDPTREAHRRAGALIQQIEAAGRWVATNGAEGRAAVLDGEDLRPLAGALAGRRLTALSARGVCAVGVDFSRAQLQGAAFDRADLRDADFTGADLRGASFEGALLWHARFDEADLRSLPLTSGRSRRVNLERASFQAGAFAKALVDPR
jgi:uncharacterized protein YjbI with pentapeptide repeats